MESFSFEEKRKYPRVRLDDAVRFQYDDPGRFGGSLGCDISEGGIRIDLNDFVPLNTKLSMEVHLSPQNIVECMGKVVWVRKSRYGDRYQAGLEFLESGDSMDAKREIHQYIGSTQYAK